MIVVLDIFEVMFPAPLRTGPALPKDANTCVPISNCLVKIVSVPFIILVALETAIVPLPL